MQGSNTGRMRGSNVFLFADPLYALTQHLLVNTLGREKQHVKCNTVFEFVVHLVDSFFWYFLPAICWLGGWVGECVREWVGEWVCECVRQ